MGLCLCGISHFLRPQIMTLSIWQASSPSPRILISLFASNCFDMRVCLGYLTYTAHTGLCFRGEPFGATPTVNLVTMEISKSNKFKESQILSVAGGDTISTYNQKKEALPNSAHISKVPKNGGHCSAKGLDDTFSCDVARKTVLESKWEKIPSGKQTQLLKIAIYS